MHRLAYWPLVVGACSLGTDNRPKTAEYATEAILVPNCSGAACHSAFAGNDGIAFDTLDGARHALVNLVEMDSVKNDRTDPDAADLIIWTTQLDPKGLGIGRMPYDRPIAVEDEDYLKRFIADGMHDAQCNPELPRWCDDTRIVTCDSDWNFGAPLGTCGQLTGTTTNCQSGLCECQPGFGDCDKDATQPTPDGCEIKLDHDGDCGGCGVACDNATTMRVCRQTVSGGKLTGLFSCQCPVGFDHCTMDSQLCETPINTDANCGGCGKTCTSPKTCMPIAGVPGGFSCQ